MNLYCFLAVSVVSISLFVNGCQSPPAKQPQSGDIATKPLPIPATTDDTNRVDQSEVVDTVTDDAAKVSKAVQETESSEVTVNEVDEVQLPETIDVTPSDTSDPPPAEEQLTIVERESPDATRGAKPLEDQNSLYDHNNPAYSILQKANEAMANFPIDIRGGVDWMRALRQGLITPRADMRAGDDMQRREDEIIMKQTRNMPYVLFPHTLHTEWLTCNNCHPKPFVAQAGANQITMNDMFQGEYCGMCHDRVAFGTFACERCHSVLHEGSPAPWW